MTLVRTEDVEHKAYGIAYEIKLENMEKTFEHLNVREKCGYSLNEVDFHTSLDINQKIQKPLLCVCYFANETNIYYSPESDTNKIAKQIYETVGPSGPNKAYLYNLCDALRFMSAELLTMGEKDLGVLKYDKHLFNLEILVKNLDSIK